MKFQTADIIVVLSIAACRSAEAYAPSSLVSRTPAAFVTSRIPKPTTSSQLFSQWDEEDEDDGPTIRSASFEEAGKAIGDEDDQAAMDEMGDFDASGTVSSTIYNHTNPNVALRDSTEKANTANKLFHVSV